MRKQVARKPCKECNVLIAIVGEKYCDKCRKLVIERMKNDGYLQDTSPPKTVSEQFGRSLYSSGRTFGGSAEINNDGDDE